MFKITINNENAVIPLKAHPSDIGYDLTAISLVKKLTEQTSLFDTGLAMTPPIGYYFEIIARSSISKTGYILSNSIGIIRVNVLQ